MRALLFLRPPAPVAQMVPEDACVGLYHPHPNEAPTASYARWLFDSGRALALPWFADRASPMQFRTWTNPYEDEELEAGPFGMQQPAVDASLVVPDVLFMPLVAFTAAGDRLGQGGGHYDRWLEANPDTTAIGLAWDVQRADTLPRESHDRPLDAVVTPTRFYDPGLHENGDA